MLRLIETTRPASPEAHTLATDAAHGRVTWRVDCLDLYWQGKTTPLSRTEFDDLVRLVEEGVTDPLFAHLSVGRFALAQVQPGRFWLTGPTCQFEFSLMDFLHFVKLVRTAHSHLKRLAHRDII